MAQHKFRLKFRSTQWLCEMVALVQASSMNDFIQRHLISHWYALPPEVLTKSSVKSLHPSRLSEIQRGSHYASYGLLHALNGLRREHDLRPWTEEEIQTVLHEDAKVYACALAAERAATKATPRQRARQGVLTAVVVPTVGSWWITRRPDRPPHSRQIAEIQGDFQTGTWRCRFQAEAGERNVWISFRTLRNAYHPAAAPAINATNGGARANLPPLPPMPGAPTPLHPSNPAYEYNTTTHAVRPASAPAVAVAVPQLTMLTSEQMRLVIAQELYAVLYSVAQAQALRVSHLQQALASSDPPAQSKAQ